MCVDISSHSYTCIYFANTQTMIKTIRSEPYFKWGTWVPGRFIHVHVCSVYTCTCTYTVDFLCATWEYRIYMLMGIGVALLYETAKLLLLIVISL